MTFAKKVELWMAENNYNKVSLAERAGVSPSALSDWLNPNKDVSPKLSVVQQLAHAMAVPVAYLADNSFERIGDAAGISLESPEGRLAARLREVGIDRATFIVGLIEELGYTTAVARLLDTGVKPTDAPADAPDKHEPGRPHSRR